MDTRNSSPPGPQIDFSAPNLHVRSILDPTKNGHTTGRLARYVGRDYALIRLKSGEISQVPCRYLELVPHKETRADTLKTFRFAGPNRLQRAVITEKVRGRLTDVFYSMGAGHAIFYPYQFKPVLKFVSVPPPHATNLRGALVPDATGQRAAP